jgi:hypothetical protein
MPRGAESYQRGAGSGRRYDTDADDVGAGGGNFYRPEEASGTPAERVLYHVIMMLVSAQPCMLRCPTYLRPEHSLLWCYVRAN